MALGFVWWFLWLAPTDRRELAESFKKTPCTQIARILSMLLLCYFFILSLPLVGFMLDGCFWSSCSGLFNVVTLACTCLPQTLEMLKVPSPPFVVKIGVGLIASASGALAAGASGIVVAVLHGDEICKNTFLAASVALVSDGVLFGWAWYRGEGGWLMGADRKSVV